MCCLRLSLVVLMILCFMMGVGVLVLTRRSTMGMS